MSQKSKILSTLKNTKKSLKISFKNFGLKIKFCVKNLNFCVFCSKNHDQFYPNLEEKWNF